MRWIVGKTFLPFISLLSILLLLVQVIFTSCGLAFQFLDKLVNWIFRRAFAIAKAALKIRGEFDRFRTEASTVNRDLTRFHQEQQTANPLDPNKKTIFLLITCGQAVRNFLLSDVFSLLRARFNVVILSPYAYSDTFRREYSLVGVHVLPWFESFRTHFERLFQYYFMSNSRSRTHHSWLSNLEQRAKQGTKGKYRFKKLLLMRRSSDFIGAIVGRRGMQGLYASYLISFLPKSLFRFLFAAYHPSLVISTTAHHPEAWPLTYFARRHGCDAVANILSWDNTTTKSVMDIACNYYTVWSEEMEEELRYQFPHIRARVCVVGCPMFDMYHHKRSAVARDQFLRGIGLCPDIPYILYTTNTPAAMPDECEIILQYWLALNRTPLSGKVSLLVRLHPKETLEKYQTLVGLPNVAVTLAAKPHWERSDRWLPNEQDLALLLNSMLHASLSVNVASTMSLESFTLGLPTINVAFKSRDDLADHGSMWSFDMYHFSEHYHALVDNGSVDLARNVDELVSFTINALRLGAKRRAAMQKTLEQKAAYSNGTSAQRFVDVINSIIMKEAVPVRKANIDRQMPMLHANPAE